MTKWIVLDVGCIECSLSTSVLGVFGSDGEANALADAYLEAKGQTKWEPASAIGFLLGGRSNTLISSGSYFDGGQHSVEVHQYDGPWEEKNAVPE